MLAKVLEIQTQEISKSKALRFYGALLSFVYLLCILYWWQYGFSVTLSNEVEAICWPWWRECQSFRLFDSNEMRFIFATFGAVAVSNSMAFIKCKNIRYPFLVLALMELVRFTLVMLDYRARLNQHYMIFFTVWTFLLIPNKLLFLRFVLVSFYFWAGTIKLNASWLTGQAIYGELWLIPKDWYPVASAYVVVLELFLIWGLFSKRKWIFWFTLAQLWLFHLESLSVVGFFYPSLMFVLLMIFPMERRWRAPSSGSKWPGLVIISIISILNIWSKTLPGDTTMTGEGRVLGLHMFDGKYICHSFAEIMKKDNTTEKLDLLIPAVVRIRCDPIVYLSRVRRLCRDLKKDEQFVDLNWTLLSTPAPRKASFEPLKFKEVVNIANFCQLDPAYNMFIHNDWIRH